MKILKVFYNWKSIFRKCFIILHLYISNRLTSFLMVWKFFYNSLKLRLLLGLPEVSQFSIFKSKEKTKNFEKSKLCEKMPNSLFEEVLHVEKRKVYRSEEFGTTGDSSIGLNAPKWSVKGIFKKFTIKSRLWDGRHIVQGIKITMADGKEHSYGMDIADKKNTIELEIPQGQYIKNLFLRAGW